jgi:hypothetical protein
MYKGVSLPQAVLPIFRMVDGYLTDLWKTAFYSYAAQNWAYHIQDAQQSVEDLALKFLMDDEKASASSQVLVPIQQRLCCCCCCIV